MTDLNLFEFINYEKTGIFKDYETQQKQQIVHQQMLQQQKQQQIAQKQADLAQIQPQQAVQVLKCQIKYTVYKDYKN